MKIKAHSKETLSILKYSIRFIANLSMSLFGRCLSLMPYLLKSIFRANDSIIEFNKIRTIIELVFKFIFFFANYSFFLR